MAITRKAPKRDIRTLNISTTSIPTPVSHDTETQGAPSQKAPVPQYNPAGDLRRIAWSTIPLFIALSVGSYLETTRPWVIAFAEWLNRIGG